MTGAKIAIIIVLIIVVVAAIGGLAYLYFASSSTSAPYMPSTPYVPSTPYIPPPSDPYVPPPVTAPKPSPVPTPVSKTIGGNAFNCATLGSNYFVESNTGMQVCRKSDGSGNWGCPSNWRKLSSAPYCEYSDASTINGKSFICPSGYNPEAGGSMQVCRKSDGSGNWTCPSNWTKIGSAPYCT